VMKSSNPDYWCSPKIALSRFSYPLSSKWSESSMSFNFLERLGCRSLLKALASICRIRSLVTLNLRRFEPRVLLMNFRLAQALAHVSATRQLMPVKVSGQPICVRGFLH